MAFATQVNLQPSQDLHLECQYSGEVFWEYSATSDLNDGIESIVKLNYIYIFNVTYLQVLERYQFVQWERY